MNVEFNIDDYLNDCEKEQIAKDCFREFFYEKIRTTDTSTILVNMSYSFLKDLIEEIMPDFENLLKKQIEERLKKKDFDYYIFSKVNNNGVCFFEKTLENIINENQEYISEKVKKEVKDYNVKDLINKEFIKNLEYYSASVDNLFCFIENLLKKSEQKND